MLSIMLMVPPPESEVETVGTPLNMPYTFETVTGIAGRLVLVPLNSSFLQDANIAIAKAIVKNLLLSFIFNRL